MCLIDMIRGFAAFEANHSETLPEVIDEIFTDALLFFTSTLRFVNAPSRNRLGDLDASFDIFCPTLA